MNKKNKQRKFETFLYSLNQVKSVTKANRILENICHVRYDFKTLENLYNFCEFAKQYDISTPSSVKGSKKWGDIQTPLEFIDQIYKLLRAMDFYPELIIEPTMGVGNFLLLGREYFPKSYLSYGVEIQEKYIWDFLIRLYFRLVRNSNSKFNHQFEIYNDDIFTHDFSLDVKDKKVLIIGNPPWITIADLSKYQSSNLPEKNNIKDFSGLDALTGKSNFDITEAIIIKLLKKFKNCQGKIALLCKDSVIKNILKNQPKEKHPITNIRSIKFDSKKIFQKTCNASLFMAEFSKKCYDLTCSLSYFDDPENVVNYFGWVNDKFVSNIELFKKNQQFDGTFPIIWRQGVKHDCSKILELTIDDTILKNKNNEIVSVESDIVYPLLKGADIRKYYVNDSSRKIILTQKKISEKTINLKHKYPKLWSYLVANKKYFKKRKSKIYKNDLFSMFGIGDYTFAPFKIAIAGLYKDPLFSLILPIENKPVILDDTCYFIGFETLEEAIVMSLILNSQIVYDFLETIIFRDSKRPYTKEALMRIDLKEIATSIDLKDFSEIEKRLNFPPELKLDFTKLCDSIRNIIKNDKIDK